jgi:hypothetical protein
MFEVAKTYDA